MLKIKELSLAFGLLFSLAATISGQCVLPNNWKKQIGSTVDQIWGVKPMAADSFDWMMYMFTDTILFDLSSNTQYQCQELQTDANGVVKILYKRVGSQTPMCFYGKVATNDASGKVLFYRKSVETLTNPPTSLAACDTQTGIDGAVYKILVRAPFENWPYNYQFGAIPDGTYLFGVQEGDSAAGCENDASSTLTKTGSQITVSSSCISTTNTGSYGNPFSETLRISDSITGPELGLGTSADAGFVILNTVKMDTSKNVPVAYRFYIMKYETVNGAFKMVFESKVPDLLPKGYWTESLIPADRQPVTTTLKSNLCAQSTTYCQNGGTCVPGFTTATCLCTDSYEGDRCENEVDKCTPNPCLNGGTCTRNGIQYTCNCVSGYTGVNCEMQDKCLNAPCQNGGSCITYRDANGVDNFYCSCLTPYTGDTCSAIDACLNTPCMNGGSCLTKSQATSINDYQCICPSGTYGSKCENIGKGPCEGDPCLNGGTCEVVGTSFRCQCAAGYSGNTCEVSWGCTEATCKNGGTCSVVGDSFYCECSSYYSGVYCEEYEDWFIILLVLVILAIIILFILITVCACYCCCGWRPGSNKTPYESYVDQQNGMSTYSGDQLTYMSAYGMPADPAPETVQFNFVPLSQYQGIATTN